MNPVLRAVRAGFNRGLIEFRHSIKSGEDIGYYVFSSLILLVVLLLQRGSTVEGTTLSLAALTLPGILGMHVAMNGVVGTASVLTGEREDGTLLRAKATPHGMLAYLIGRVCLVTGGTLVSLVIILVPAFFLVDGVADAGASGGLNLVWVIVLGLLATLPWGAVLGSLFVNPQAAWGITMLAIGSLVAISGIFYPFQALWGWLQGIAQLFPIYWLGLGMRSAILPDAAAAVEIGDSWRTAETIGVLVLWAVAGLLIAPAILRRMARNESVSAVEARRQKALQRV
jgi:ABC-2 type transport system permease protein